MNFMLKRHPTLNKLLCAFGLFFVTALGILGLTQGEVLGLTIKVTKDREAQRSAQVLTPEPEAAANTSTTFPDVDPNIFAESSSDGQAITASQPDLNLEPTVLNSFYLILISAYMAWGLTALLALLVALTRVCRVKLSLKTRTRYFRLFYLALIWFISWFTVGSGVMVLLLTMAV
jgi:hypothetical protein